MKEIEKRKMKVKIVEANVGQTLRAEVSRCTAPPPLFLHKLKGFRRHPQIVEVGRMGNCRNAYARGRTAVRSLTEVRVITEQRRPPLFPPGPQKTGDFGL